MFFFLSIVLGITAKLKEGQKEGDVLNLNTMKKESINFSLIAISQM